MMKRWLLLAILAGCARAHGADLPPPSQMSIDSAVRLDRDLSHLRELNAQIERLQQDGQKYADDIKAILSAAKIDLQAFNRGDVVVDLDNGKIARKPAALPSK